MLQVAIPARQRVGGGAVAAHARRRQRRGELLHLALDAPHVLEATEDFGEERARLVAAGDLLGKVADRRAPRAADTSMVRLLEPGQDAAEGGLAGTVRPHEADPLAIGDPPLDVAEERLPAVALGDVLELDHPLTTLPG